MVYEIILPKQGLQMIEGTITRWFKAEGDTIQAGEPLFEMETDKVVMTIDAAASGKLQQIYKGEGETVPVGEVIALLSDVH